MNDKALQEQLDIDRANDVSPLSDTLSEIGRHTQQIGYCGPATPILTKEQTEEYFKMKQDIAITPVEAAMTHSTLAPHQIEPCGDGQQGVASLGIPRDRDFVDPEVTMYAGKPDNGKQSSIRRSLDILKELDITPTFKIDGVVVTEEEYRKHALANLESIESKMQRAAVTADALSDWTISDKTHPELDDLHPCWRKHFNRWGIDKTVYDEKNQHCPRCEPDNGTKPALHPECYRQQQEDTLFKRTWMVVGVVIVILTGVAWLVLK